MVGGWEIISGEISLLSSLVLLLSHKYLHSATAEGWLSG